jgi:hypothetical protein
LTTNQGVGSSNLSWVTSNEDSGFRCLFSCAKKDFSFSCIP